MEDKKKFSGKHKIISLLLVLITLLVVYWLVQNFFTDKYRVHQIVSDANAYLAEEKYSAAEKLYEHALELEVDNVEALIGIAGVKIHNKELEEAKTYLDRVPEEKQHDKVYKSMLFAYAMKVEDYQLAQSLSETNSDFVKSPEQYIKMLEGLISGDYMQQAMIAVKQAIRDFPEDKKLCEYALHVALLANDEEWALEVFNQGVEDISVEDINKISAIYEKNQDISKLISTLEESLLKNFEQKELKDKLYKLYAETNDMKNLWGLRVKMLKAKEDLPKLDINIQGNSFANARYSSFATQQGNTIYFLSSYTRYIYKAPESDLSEASLLINKRVNSLNVKGQYLYFVSIQDGNSIYRANTDASEVTKLWDAGDAADMVVYADKIYFINMGDNSINRMNLDGSDVEKLDTPAIFQYVLDPFSIYYLDASKQSLYKQDFTEDGSLSSPEQIVEGRFKDLNIDEFSNLYFLDLDSGGNLLKLQKGATNAQVLSKAKIEFLNYSQGELFYVNWTPMKMSTDGSNAVNLASNFSAELAVVNQWVFSLEDILRDFMNVYYFKKDGSEWQISTTFN